MGQDEVWMKLFGWFRPSYTRINTGKFVLQAGSLVPILLFLIQRKNFSTSRSRRLNFRSVFRHETVIWVFSLVLHTLVVFTISAQFYLLHLKLLIMIKRLYQSIFILVLLGFQCNAKWISCFQKKK